MKFEELKNSLKNKVYPMYLLIGEDSFLLSSSFNLIYKFSKVEFKDLNFIKFSEGIIDCEDVCRALNTMPVFSDRKIVYLDLRMTKKSEFKNSKLLDDYLNNPNNMAILIVNLGDSSDIVFDKSKFEVVDCNRLDYKIIYLKIKDTFKKYNKDIEDNAIKLLSDYCLGDLSKILLECEKLNSYCNDNKIVIQDIRDIVNQSLEYKIFELTDGLAKKDSKKVFTIIHDIENKKDEYKTLPALIYAHFRRLLHISLNKTLSTFEISKMLGIKEYAVKMSMKQIGYFTKSSLKKINDLCADLDYDLKQSNISIENLINVLILNILNLK